jgi:acetoin utilization deacetylase AcuC-like enzyme
MGKYALVRDALIESGTLPRTAMQEPAAASRDALELAHTSEYVSQILQGTLPDPAARVLGFPWSPELRERSCRTVQGTLEAARDALALGAGINLAGGTHHAFPDRGEGFCVFNDVAVAIRVLQREGRIRRAAIVDLDVHQGNGSARVFMDDPDVFTFSVHGEHNYPFRKEASTLDVGLDDGCDDASYLKALDNHLDDVLDQAGADLVFYLAGADPFAGDRFGRLRLSMDGLVRRDRMVFEACARRGVPVVMVLAGGYAPDLRDVATIHGNTVRELLTLWN